MKKANDLSVILILDYNERNAEPHFTPIGIVDSVTEELVRGIIAEWVASETNLSDEDGIEFLNECVHGLCKNDFFQDDDYEVAFKIETATYYKNE